MYSKQAEGRHGYGFCEWLWIEATATFALDFPQNVAECQWNFINRMPAGAGQGDLSELRGSKMV